MRFTRTLFIVLLIIFFSWQQTKAQDNKINESDLWKGTIYNFEEAFAKPNKVKSLYINDDSLYLLPKEIKRFKSLEILSLVNTHVEEFPNEMQELVKLKFLYLENDRNLDLDQALGVLPNHSLTKISILNNGLSIFPNVLNNFINLKELSLYKNHLEFIPDEMQKFTKLETLLLSENELETLPNSFSELCNLKTLTISNNRFEILPEVICSLKNLENIYVGNKELNSNQAIQILSKCEGLRFINLSKIVINESVNFSPLAELENLENLELINVYKSFEEILFEQLFKLNFNVTIRLNFEPSEDQLTISKNFPNVTIGSLNEVY